MYRDRLDEDMLRGAMYQLDLARIRSHVTRLGSTPRDVYRCSGCCRTSWILEHAAACCPGRRIRHDRPVCPICGDDYGHNHRGAAAHCLRWVLSEGELDNVATLVATERAQWHEVLGLTPPEIVGNEKSVEAPPCVA